MARSRCGICRAHSKRYGAVKSSKDVRDRVQGHAFGEVALKQYDRYDAYEEKHHYFEKLAS